MRSRYVAKHYAVHCVCISEKKKKKRFIIWKFCIKYGRRKQSLTGMYPGTVLISQETAVGVVHVKPTVAAFHLGVLHLGYFGPRHPQLYLAFLDLKSNQLLITKKQKKSNL